MGDVIKNKNWPSCYIHSPPSKIGASNKENKIRTLITTYNNNNNFIEQCYTVPYNAMH